MRTGNQNIKKGFTLIELLVVVSIIALLVSILMPALNKAKELAQMTICMTRLKQQGIGMYMYADDHQYLPHNVNCWDYQNYYLYGEAAYWGMPGDDYVWMNNGLLYGLKYITAPEIFACPKDKFFYGSGASASVTIGEQAFYHHGGTLLSTGGWERSIRTSYLTRPRNPEAPGASSNYTDPIHFKMSYDARFALLADWFIYSDYYRMHGDIFNVLYADAHVQTVPDRDRYFARMRDGVIPGDVFVKGWFCLDEYSNNNDFTHLFE